MKFTLQNANIPEVPTMKPEEMVEKNDAGLISTLVLTGRNCGI